MTDTLLVVMVHAEAQETFDRHLPLWEAHGCDIIVFCPFDAIVSTRLPVWAVGKRSHHGAEANRRFKELLRMLERTTYDRFLICEYDAFCLSPKIPVFFQWSDQHSMPTKNFSRPYVCGNVFRDDRPDRGFEGTTFIHPPLLFTHYGLQDINVQLKHLPDRCEGGFWDRMLGLACEEAGIEPLDFMKHGLGYAQNTIEQHQFGSAFEAAANGALFLHGCKSPEALAVIEAGHGEAKRHGNLPPLEIPV